MKAGLILNVSKSMENQKPYIVMLFIQFVYAGMALFSKAAIGAGMNPFVFVFYRQAFASLALTPFSIFLERKKAPPPTFSLLCKIFFIALCGITLSLNLYNFGFKYTSATVATATANTIPAITFIIAAFFRMESISVKNFYGVVKVAGTVMCLSGALMVALDKGPPAKFMNWNPSSSAHHHQTGQMSNDPSSSSSSNSKADSVKGALIMLSANSAWSLWLILQGSIMKIYPAKIHLTTLQCWFSCIQTLIVALIFERNPSSWKLGWNIHLLSVAYCGIVVTGITYWLQAWCIERKGPVFIAMFTPLALLITAIFSAFLWKEQTLHWGSVGGAVLLVGGLYGVLWGKNKEEVITSTERNENFDDEEANNKQGSSEQTGEAKELTKLECIINTHK